MMPQFTGTTWGDAPNTQGTPGGVVTWSIAVAGTDISHLTGNSGDVSSERFDVFDYQVLLDAILGAFDAWSAHGNIEFVQVGDPGPGKPGFPNADQPNSPDIRIHIGPVPGEGLGVSLAPGDAYGAGGILIAEDPALAQDPALLEAVLLREIGHAIGLDYMPDGSVSVMTPTITQTELQADDIAGVQQLYGVQDNTLPAVLDMSDNWGFTVHDRPENLVVIGNFFVNYINVVGEGTVTLNGPDAFFNVLQSVDGSHELFGGPGKDRLIGGDGQDTLWGADGNDTIETGGAFNELHGGAGNDSITGSEWFDNIYGGAGNDTLHANGGHDRLFGDEGDDELHGGSIFGATDIGGGFFGGDGNDTLWGTSKDDRFFGGFDEDVINGLDGDDSIYGGAGSDTITGGLGDDLIQGDTQADMFIFADGHGADTITDFEALHPLERIDLSAVSAINSLIDLNLADPDVGAATQVGADVVINTGGGHTITLLGVNIGDLDANDFVF